jgi:hypothetical protein
MKIHGIIHLLYGKQKLALPDTTLVVQACLQHQYGDGYL